MTRDVIFRGKLSHSGAWVFGSLLKIDSNYHIVTESDMCEDGHHIRQKSDTPTWVDSDTVGQFTGMTDKNEVKIFEGDVVKRISVNSDSSLYYDCGVVIFDNGNASFKLSMYKCVFNGRDIGLFDDNDDATCNFVTNVVYDGQTPQEDEYCYEVIGNIHDNSELLSSK